MDRSMVAKLLGELRDEGVVAYQNRRWTLKSLSTADKRKVRRASPSSTAEPQASKTRSPSKPSSVDVSSAAADAPLACLPFSASTAEAPETLGQVAWGSALPVGWPLLQRLIPYWRASLRAEERPNTILPLERANIEFCGLTTADPWWPTEQRRAELTITTNHLPEELLATLARRGTESDVFVGYPLQLIPGTGDRSAFARPIFTYACGLEMTAGTLKLTLQPQPIDINADWLEKQFRDPMERRAVLRWLGIVGGTGQEDDSETQAPGEPLDLPTATARLGAYLPPEAGGALMPTALATSLPLQTEKPCIINVLTLSAASITRYSKRTLADLDRLAKWTEQQSAKSALAELFAASSCSPASPTSPPMSIEVPALPPLPMNEEQLSATRAALNRGLTVITGPPGTGKSQVVAAIMASAALMGRTALLASKNHKALDAVEQRLAELLSNDRSILARASRPYGGGQGFNLQRAADSLFARAGSTGERIKLGRAVTRLCRIDHDLADLEAQLQFHADLGDDVAEAEDRIEECEFALTNAQHTWIRQAPALQLPSPPPEHIKEPRFVPLFGPLWHWLHSRRQRNFMARIAPLNIPWSSGDQQQRLVTYRRMVTYLAALAALEVAKTRLIPISQVAELTDKVVEGRQDLAKQSANLFQTLPAALEDLSDDTRPELAELSGSMAIFAGEKLGDEGARERRRVMQRALPLLLKHFPLWAVTNLSAGRALPLMPGLFDYVIVDEASQCDIASAVLLLARAKRAVVVGDPAQLRHVTKLTQERERRFLETSSLLAPGIGRWCYRSQSLFNIAAATPGVSAHTLRDHYRSAGAVADYCNDAFYGGRLRVLTDENGLRPPPGQQPGIHWTDVSGSIQSAASGCYAPDEADAIVAHLKHLLVEQDYGGTIGVVTPFREQAKRITDKLTAELPAQRIVSAQLGAFTAHQFQGDARDLILMSLCLGPETPVGSRTFLAEGGNLINVAVSRARAVCHIFGNRDAARQSGIPHILKLSQAVDRRAPQSGSTSQFESPWEETLYNALKARNIEPIPQFPVAGRRLDLAVIANGTKLDIEVDGDRYHRDPSGRRKSGGLWRDHQLRSLGWHVKRYWVYQLRENLDECVDDIIAAAGE